MDENLKAALGQAERVLGRKPEWLGFRKVREVSTTRYVRDGHPQANHSSLSEGVMVEVLENGQFGYAATTRTDSESLVMAAQKARIHASQGSRYPIHRFTVAQRPTVQGEFESNFGKSIPSAGELNDLLVEICRKLDRPGPSTQNAPRPKMIRRSALFETVDTEVQFVSSNGSDARQNTRQLVGWFQATAQAGDVVQKRSDERCGQGGWERFNTPDLWNRVERVAEEALELTQAEDCPSEKLDLVLMPDQMMLQIHESIGHPLELDRILGDERNYAGWSFVKKEDFGSFVYGSPLMNVTFDPGVAGELASYAFDDNGMASTREYLIKDGILVRPLGGVESQARSGLPGVANSRACLWNRPPIDRMANLNLEPGNDSLAEIIASVDRGVLMKTNRSWSIDDFRNKFQFGCEYAKLIENGKLTRTLKNANYRGITAPFWRSLKKVGDPSTVEIFGATNCGKGEPNQSIRVGHSSPVCLFKNVEIFGGAS
ncbi:MAG: Zn-dependent protease [Bdellovibrionales bacterium RIFOXYC1_FULL_54_43]|nr:MAG: Zn-dependent protease [Bdellovibrionales bacterium RIFOXYC1_FULL_54_43]OFZ84086.1 MAG: Zn-dependent protease [Bdellovibrionales bacterium RIFOXYD1_FULL_55_31]